MADQTAKPSVGYDDSGTSGSVMETEGSPLRIEEAGGKRRRVSLMTAAV